MDYKDLGQPYKTDSLSLYNCDCMELLRQTPDNYYCLSVVDPPYGIGAGGKSFKNGTSKNSDGGFKDNDWDLNRPTYAYFKELQRVSKNQVVWGGNYFADMLPAKMCWLFWDKGTGDNSYADGELAWTSYQKAVKKVFISWVGANANNGAARIHPTEKPVKLYNWILANYAEKGMKILDTHMGSGSIAIACHYAECYLTACELDQDYYREACKRIERETSQTAFSF